MTPARFHRILLHACVCLAVLPAARAQDASSGAATPLVDPTALPQIVIDAYRVPRPLTHITQAVSVIGRDDIERRQPASVLQLLQSMAGVHVDRLGGPGGRVNTYVRGADPNHTLFLIDGVRVNDPTDARGGSYNLSGISPEEIERIEVLRGAGGAQFGADATGGVVNVVTRRAAAGQPSADIAAGVGAIGYRMARAAVSGSSDTVQAQGAAGRHEDGQASSGGTSEQSSLSATLRWQPTDVLQTRWHARQAHSDSLGFPDFSGGIEQALNRALEQRNAEERQWGTDLQLELSPRIQLLGQASRFARDEQRDTPVVLPGPGGFVPLSRAQTDFERTIGSLTASVGKLPGATQLVMGLEAQREAGAVKSVSWLPGPTPGAFDRRRSTHTLHGEVTSSALAPLTLVFAARNDRTSDFGSRSSLSGGAAWILANATTLRTNVSEGFKPPSFYALGDPLVGNPALLPETNRTLEVGIEHGRGRARVQATVFRNHFENLIDFDPQLFRLVNRKQVQARGAELEVGWADRRIGLRGTASLMHFDVGSEAATLRNRPERRASVVLDAQPIDALSVFASLIYTGRTLDFSVPTAEFELPSQLRVDLAVSYVMPRLRLTAAIDNLTDRPLASYVGFLDPGRRVRVTAAMKI